MRFPIPLLLLALAVSGCAKHGSGAFRASWGDTWIVQNPSQIDVFFDGLKTKLASEGFTLSEPMTGEGMAGFVATAGQQPNKGDRVYWFKGNYQGSPMYFIELVRNGPRLEVFTVTYYWDVVGGYGTSPQKEMEGKMHSLHESLTDWASKGNLAYLPGQ